MSTALDVARATLLNPAELDEARLSRVLDGLMKPGIDAADLYFQFSKSEHWSLEEGIVKSGSHNVEQGVGVRAVSGDRQGLAYTEELRYDALQDAATAARAIVDRGATHSLRALTESTGRTLYPAINPLDTLPTPEKLQLLRRADRAWLPAQLNPANEVIRFGASALPWVYDRLVGPLFGVVATDLTRPTGPTTGNVLAPRPDGNSLRGTAGPTVAGVLANLRRRFRGAAPAATTPHEHVPHPRSAADPVGERTSTSERSTT